MDFSAIKPFEINTDPKFLWVGEKHQEALAALKYGIMSNKGFVVLSGDAGTGKTTLINGMLDRLEDDVMVTTVFDPRLDIVDFFNYLADGFGLKKRFSSKGDFIVDFTRFLHKAHDDQKKVLLIIDEAHRIDNALLDEILLLSNIEKQNVKLLYIFFVGDTAFNTTIQSPGKKALKQRIIANCSLERLTKKETKAYIRHRLRISGIDDDIFSQRAIGGIYAYSNGIPQLINIIGNHALLASYAYSKDNIDLKTIKECARELKLDRKESTIETNSVPKPNKDNIDGSSPRRSRRIVPNLRPRKSFAKSVGFLVLFSLLFLVVLTLVFINKKSDFAGLTNKQPPAKRYSIKPAEPVKPLDFNIRNGMKNRHTLTEPPANRYSTNPIEPEKPLDFNPIKGMKK